MNLLWLIGNEEEDQKRLEKAMESYTGMKNKPYILISGEIPLQQVYSQMYKPLREHGVKHSEFIIERKSQDTLENFLYSIKRLKKKEINNIRIATNPTQYWRFKLFEKEAKKEGLIDDSFKIEPIYTSESLKEFIYGCLAYVKDYIRVKSAGSLEKAKNQKTGSFGNFLKNILNAPEKK